MRKATVERIVDLKTEPVVGRTYLVPCLLVGEMVGEAIWVPIMGDKHNDAKLAPWFEADHWHMDWRFLTPAGLASTVGGAIRSTTFEAEIASGYCFAWVVHRYVLSAETERRMRCLRAMPRYAQLHRNYQTGKFQQNHLSIAVNRAYAGARAVQVNGCSVCPHRGLPLSGLPKEKDGGVVCRGHGLRFSADGRVKQLERK